MVSLQKEAGIAPTDSMTPKTIDWDPYEIKRSSRSCSQQEVELATGAWQEVGEEKYVFDGSPLQQDRSQGEMNSMRNCQLKVNLYYASKVASFNHERWQGLTQHKETPISWGKDWEAVMKARRQSSSESVFARVTCGSSRRKPSLGPYCFC